MFIQSIRSRSLSTVALAAILSAFGWSSLSSAAPDDDQAATELAAETDAPLDNDSEELVAVCAAGVVIGPISLFFGGPGSDDITGTPNEDVLGGAGCDDVISAANGEDLVSGGAGDDTLNGGGADDVLLGGPGIDTIDGSVGADQLFGGPGADSLDGGGDNSDDLLFGGCDGVSDTMDGGPGNNDICIGEVGLDVFSNCELVIPCP
jgi:Ca2+-binding RTX toxin-like protein